MEYFWDLKFNGKIPIYFQAISSAIPAPPRFSSVAMDSSLRGMQQQQKVAAAVLQTLAPGASSVPPPSRWRLRLSPAMVLPPWWPRRQPPAATSSPWDERNPWLRRRFTPRPLTSATTAGLARPGWRRTHWRASARILWAIGAESNHGDGSGSAVTVVSDCEDHW